MAIKGGKFLPDHDTQYEPTTKASPFDCNMQACCDAVRFFTLGLKDYNHDQMRHLSGTYHEVTDNNPNNNGTSISDAVRVLTRLGVKAIGYDSGDDKGFQEVRAALARGEVVIAHGDYGDVPVALRGPIDRSFNGMHSVYFHAEVTADGVKQIKVGDGLANAYKMWPLAVAQKYLAGFFGSGFTFARIVPATLKVRRSQARVRERPAFHSKSLGIIRAGADSLHYYGKVKGTRKGDTHPWYRVHYNGSIGYVHSTVAVPR